jgi:hypothetical protein
VFREERIVLVIAGSVSELLWFDRAAGGSTARQVSHREWGNE